MINLSIISRHFFGKVFIWNIKIKFEHHDPQNGGGDDIFWPLYDELYFSDLQIKKT